MPMSRVQIRTMIIFGFVLSAVAEVISYVFNVTTGGYQFDSFRVVVDPLFGPLTTITAVVAWWWLTQLEARDDAQLTILRRAYLFFALQYVLFAATFNFIFTPIHNFGSYWVTTSLWFDLLGALTTALGLFLMSRSLVTLMDVERPTSDVREAIR